ncbi:MAG: hypothetical protein NW220_01285 [Leptolyngbyaceae cyanobacterium bins.349]|nr:hypothetical protein [Leptolyngbyaceae cyanobacterium bins.349]
MPITRCSLQLIAAYIALGLTTIGAESAAAATLTWTLTFTSNDTVIGTGEFSYDDAKVVVVRSPQPYSDYYIADKDDPIRPDFIPPFPGLWTVTRYPNPLVSFIANLPGQTWTLNFPSWWAPEGPGSLLGSFQCGRSGCLTANQWFAGSTLGLAPGQFAMFGGTPIAADRYSGTFVSAPIPSSPTSLVSGTWTATAVPEPITLAGAAIAGTGYWLSRKRPKQ